MRRITTFWDFAAYDLLLLVGPKLPSIGQYSQPYLYRWHGRHRHLTKSVGRKLT